MSWDTVFKNKEEASNVEVFIEDFYDKYKDELKGKKLLDLGCGTGRHVLYLASKGVEVYALDKSKIGLNILNEKIKTNSKIKLIESDISEIPFPNDYFHVVLSISVLHHGNIKQIKRWLDEIKRVIEPGGLLIISVLSINDKRANTGKEIEYNTRLNISDTFDPEIPHHFFTKGELATLLKDYTILEMKQSHRSMAKNYGAFAHWDVVARRNEF